jgi:hypothetical protein
MSAYSLPGYALSVINSKNQIIRESNQDNLRTACLEFGEEYRLRIKNKTDRRAYCTVQIDGMDVSPGVRFLLQPKQTLDLERFVLDGDLTKGKRFKFISLEAGTRTGEIQDPTNPSNGLISVVFLPEYVASHFSFQPVSAPSWTFQSIPTVFTNSVLQSVVNAGVFNTSNETLTFTSTSGSQSPNSDRPVLEKSSAGATVEGSDSNQSFRTDISWFPTESPVTMMIQLKGKVQTIPKPNSEWVINEKGKVFYRGEAVSLDSYRIQEGKLHLHGLHLSVGDFSFIK